MNTGTPIYPLKDVTDLAKARKVGFSSKALCDLVALGYTIEQARECISWISADEYWDPYDYGDKLKFDAYVTKHRGPDGVLREIYVKLKIPNPATIEQVYVTSFHEPEFPTL